MRKVKTNLVLIDLKTHPTLSRLFIETCSWLVLNPKPQIS